MISLAARRIFLQSQTTAKIFQITPATSQCSHKQLFHDSAVLNGRSQVGQHIRNRKHMRDMDNDWTTDLKSWSDKNNRLYPPMESEVGVRPAEIFHGRAHVNYPVKKLLAMSKIIVNMNVDEAIGHLSHVNSKAAMIIRDTLAEAKELAVSEHNVEFKSNLHVVRSFAIPDGSQLFINYHGRGGRYKGRHRFTNYYVMLREGPAPPPYPKLTALESAKQYVQELRHRVIYDGL